MKQVDIFGFKNVDVEKLEDGSTLLTKPMEVVMHESMMPYAEHVILDRALPRVEDGLKPVNAVFCTLCTNKATFPTNQLANLRVLSATAWVVITLTVTLPSTTQWCVWLNHTL